MGSSASPAAGKHWEKGNADNQGQDVGTRAPAAAPAANPPDATFDEGQHAARWSRPSAWHRLLILVALADIAAPSSADAPVV